MPANPYISFVLYSRNDDYGGDLVFKLERSLNFLIAQLTDHALDAEIIVVEWNPPTDQPLLRGVLRLEQSTRVQVRFIVVPPRYHRRLRLWNQFPGSAGTLATNVGIRRARGQFIVSRASDVFYSEPLMEFLARRELRTDRVYRINRVDVPEAVLDTPAADRSAFLELCSNDGVHEYRVLGVPAVPAGLSLHTNASGDFMLASRASWQSVRGFPEAGSVVSMDSDGLALYALVASGLEQQILPPDHCLFKVRHGDLTPERTGKEPLTPLVGQLEKTLLEDLNYEFQRSSLHFPRLGDVLRFWMRLIFNEPRRVLLGVPVPDYPSYAEYLYRVWLLSEGRPRPLIAKVGQLRRILRAIPPEEIEKLRKLRGRLVFLGRDAWAAHRVLDPELFSYRRLAGRVYRLLRLGLARRPYVLNGRHWGLGTDDLPERGLARISEGSQ